MGAKNANCAVRHTSRTPRTRQLPRHFASHHLLTDGAAIAVDQGDGTMCAGDFCFPKPPTPFVVGRESRCGRCAGKSSGESLREKPSESPGKSFRTAIGAGSGCQHATGDNRR